MAAVSTSSHLPAPRAAFLSLLALDISDRHCKPSLYADSFSEHCPRPPGCFLPSLPSGEIARAFFQWASHPTIFPGHLRPRTFSRAFSRPILSALGEQFSRGCFTRSVSLGHVSRTVSPGLLYRGYFPRPIIFPDQSFPVSNFLDNFPNAFYRRRPRLPI